MIESYLQFSAVIRRYSLTPSFLFFSLLTSSSRIGPDLVEYSLDHDLHFKQSDALVEFLVFLNIK